MFARLFEVKVKHTSEFVTFFANLSLSQYYPMVAFASQTGFVRTEF